MTHAFPARRSAELRIEEVRAGKDIPVLRPAPHARMLVQERESFRHRHQYRQIEIDSEHHDRQQTAQHEKWDGLSLGKVHQSRIADSRRVDPAYGKHPPLPSSWVLPHPRRYGSPAPPVETFSVTGRQNGHPPDRASGRDRVRPYL